MFQCEDHLPHSIHPLLCLDHPLPQGSKLILLCLSRTQNIVTKINILLQEIRDMKVQNQKKHIFNDHKSHPKDTDEENVQDDTHLIYNNASSHPPPDKQNTPVHHAPNPSHIPNIDGNAFAQQKPDPYKLWSASLLDCLHPHHPMRIRQTAMLASTSMDE